MKYVFHPEALAEYAEAVQYYNRQRPDVAQAFINAVENAIYRIRESPESWSAIEEDVQHCLTRRFPYGILYSLRLTISAPSLCQFLFKLFFGE